MGKTELFIIIVILLFGVGIVALYVFNSKKINKSKQSAEKKEDKKEEKPVNLSELPRQDRNDVNENGETTNIREVMREVSLKSENYIKSLDLKQNNDSGVTFEEIAVEEIDKYKTPEEEAAIILGIKKQKVHVFEDEEDTVKNETTTSILNEMDEQEMQTISEKSSGISLDSFEEDDSVAEEFKDLSRKMKVMMVTDVFKKKYEDKDQEE